MYMYLFVRCHVHYCIQYYIRCQVSYYLVETLNTQSSSQKLDVVKLRLTISITRQQTMKAGVDSTQR